ncbi:ATP-binding cassette domain-containing protein [Streptomyces sp. NPDC017638]|uniref:ATP-binding cassette domain-containing protein n=1 Tax=Streptomyces sp. NPDC017638 TaxID=3365004 RepID=UPI0037A08C49
MLQVIQAFGLTSNSRKAHPPAVDDVSFEARAGQVTALLGRAGAGKTTTLKLMLELQQGRGVTYFRGRPLHRIAHPSREVGVLLGDVPGHPARSVRGHLRMLCAAAGVPARRADEVLEVVGLVSFREERLDTLSRGMDRRLGLACALLPDPHTLVLDEPTDGLSAREAQWLHGMLRAHADQGGTVLFTTAVPKEAARTADRVVTLDGGRLVAEQEARVFARTRLRRRVAVRSPHAARLAALLAKDARTARRSVEVVREGGNRLSVYGSTTADVGEIAFRHGILVHQLADEVGDMGPGAGAQSDEDGRRAESRPTVSDSAPADRRDRPERDPADLRSTALDRSAGPHNPVQGLSSGDAAASGQPAGRREHAPSEPPAPETERAAGGPSPMAEGLSASARSAPQWARNTDGGHSRTVERQIGRDHSTAVSGAPSHDAAPAVAALPADGPATRDAAPAAVASPAGAPTRTGTASGTDGTSAGATGRTAQPWHRRAESAGNGENGGDGGRPADATAAPETGRRADASTARPRTDGTSSRATAVLGARLRLPGARNPGARQTQADQPGHPDRDRATLVSSPLPPPISVRPAPSPLRPLRYEIRRAAGIGTGFLTCGAVLVVSVLTALLLARIGHTPQARLFAAWPRELPLPPAALGAGLLGALAFGDEFRHPALAADRGTVPRRLGLLTAKLLVSGATAWLLAFLTLGCDAEALYVVYGRELTEVPADWLPLTASWFGLIVGCAWAGVLAAGVFRSTTAGLAAVLAVPVLLVPVVHKALQGPAVRLAADFPVRMREVFLLQWPFGGDRYLLAAARILAQPFGGALALSLAGLLCAYLLTALRSRLR